MKFLHKINYKLLLFHAKTSKLIFTLIIIAFKIASHYA